MWFNIVSRELPFIVPGLSQAARSLLCTRVSSGFLTNSIRPIDRTAPKKPSMLIGSKILTFMVIQRSLDPSWWVLRTLLKKTGGKTFEKTLSPLKTISKHT